MSPASPLELNQESLAGIWQQVLSQIGFILASELRKLTNVAIFGPNTLALHIPAGYNLQGQQYLDASRLAKVEEALTKIVGQPCSLRLEIADSDGPGAVAEEPAKVPASTATRQRQRTEIAQIPLVGKAMEALGGQIMQMDDDFGAQTTPVEVPETGDATEEG